MLGYNGHNDQNLKNVFQHDSGIEGYYMGVKIRRLSSRAGADPGFFFKEWV
jgi:hypothetical protein